MNRSEFVQAFRNSGEVTSSHLDQLASAVAGGTAEQAAEALLDGVLLEFSRDRARIVTTTAAAWAGTDITLTGWFLHSSIVFVETPTGQHPPTYITADDYDLDTDAGTIYLTNVTVGASYRIRYKAVHEIPAMPGNDADPGTEPDPVTIPATLHAAYFKLAAVLAFERLAARYAETTGSGFTADSVNYQSKSAEYSRLAREARAKYRSMLGLSETYTPPACGFAVELDTPDYRTFADEAPWTV